MLRLFKFYCLVLVLCSSFEETRKTTKDNEHGIQTLNLMKIAEEPQEDSLLSPLSIVN